MCVYCVHHNLCILFIMWNATDLSIGYYNMCSESISSGIVVVVGVYHFVHMVHTKAALHTYYVNVLLLSGVHWNSIPNGHARTHGHLLYAALHRWIIPGAESWTTTSLTCCIISSSYTRVGLYMRVCVRTPGDRYRDFYTIYII